MGLCAGVGVLGCAEVVGEVACETLARFRGGIVASFVATLAIKHSVGEATSVHYGAC